MNAKVRFALGALFTPVLLLEDGLRKAGMDIPAEGMLHNAEGKSISELDYAVEDAIRFAKEHGIPL